MPNVERGASGFAFLPPSLTAEMLGESWGNKSPKQPFMSMKHDIRMVHGFW